LRRRHGRLPGPQRGGEPDPHPAFRRPRSGVGERHLADIPRRGLLLGAVAQDRRAEGEPQRMKPQLSVVATSRNDEHGGHLFARMQLFVDGLAEQAGRFRLPVELVLVEWNPPTDRPPLAEALRWAPNEYFLPRVITVPPDVHRTFPHADGLPLFQMIGKNVGIRRSSAPFVLATNIDILFSDELFAFFGTGLRPNAMYRVDRYDVLAELGGARLPSPAECRAL